MNQQVQKITKTIGGDPIKLHGNTLRGISNTFSYSSYNIDEIIEFDLSKYNVGPKKSFGFSKKMGNTTLL